MKQSSFDATISALDAETSALGAATSAIARSYRRYRRGVSGDIGDCGVGITPQMSNRVTNHGDMSTFSKPGARQRYHAMESVKNDESGCTILMAMHKIMLNIFRPFYNSCTHQ